MAEPTLAAESFIWPDWRVPPRVRAVTTTRVGGVSRGAWQGLDLATHCGDQLAAVATNRRALCTALDLRTEPAWLEQVHGVGVVKVSAADGEAASPCRADAAWTDEVGAVCAILTADCLPVVLADASGSVVAVAHAGWRGLAGGVVEATVAALPVAPASLSAWLGPCIGPTAFEVGEEVRVAFCDGDRGAIAAFRPTSRAGHWLADLPALARRRLATNGVRTVFGGRWCTYSDPQRFFSYRRDGVTGRMATLAWLDQGRG
ncbi:MAG TPA: peptidoglycan editing factor PgeF [Nevskiaceae bacterium]|nr:peptidoglycan editing factor PgeF [Nevskiaceae bacterium]